MVQGISKQVIVVQPKDEDIFEEAIFILKEDVVAKGGISDAELMRQARQAIRQGRVKVPASLWHSLVFVLLGAGLSCAVWVAVLLF